MPVRHLAARAVQYGVALLATALAVLLRWLLDPILGPLLPLATIFGAVAVAVWYGGAGPAIAASIVGFAASAYLFMDPRGTWTLEQARPVGLLLYLISCAAIILFGHRMRRAERRRRQSEEQLHLALAAGHIVTWSWDLKTGRIETSPEGRQLIGAPGFASLEEGIEAFHPEDRPALRAAIEQATAEGRPFAIEGRYTRPADGTTLRVVSRGVVQVGQDGTPEVISGVSIDVTEERRALESFHRERELLQGILDTIPVMITVHGPGAERPRWNREVERLLGRSSESAAGARLEEAVADPEARRRFLAHLTEREEGWKDFTMRAPDGRTLETSWASLPLSDGTRIGIGIDITMRQRAEGAVRRQNERLRLLWEAAGIVLATDDPDSMLHELFRRIRPQLGLDAYLNYMALESGDGLKLASFAGVPPEVVRNASRIAFGQGLSGQVALERRPIVRTRMQEPGANDEYLARALGIRTCVCTPLVAGERLLGTLAFGSRSRDAFEPDEIEFLETISHYVTVAYDRLRFIRELQESGRMKDEFLATLAHELRNPLAPIRNAVHLVSLKAPADPELRWAQEVIDRQAGHLTRLVDDLLDVSRITRGKIELRRERVLLSAIVSTAVETSRPTIEANRHELRVLVPKEPIFVHGDLTRLAQVVSNLLTNAAKYTPPNGEIRLMAERNGQEAVLRVVDNGVGIPSEMLARVFDMFTQVDFSFERSAGGLGIGLTLARTLVELHGGTIEAKSGGAGRGSEFVVRLPLATADHTERPWDSGKAAAKPSGPAIRILVVDDNQDAAESLVRILRAEGHDVRVAYGGLEALRQAEEFRPRLVLLDIGLPMLNGYQVARRIREQPWGAAIWLVALTGWGQEEDRRRSKEAGFDDHLVKPVHPAALESVVARGRTERRATPASH